MVDKVRYGDAFRLPTNREKRRHKAVGPKRLITADELWALLNATENADRQLHAMILLGINGGLGNSDCGKLTLDRMDWKHGTLNYPRPKTGVDRVVPLWPETAAALRRGLEVRVEPPAERWHDLVFTTERGRPWLGAERRSDVISTRFRRYARAAGIYRDGLSFYTLRHTFLTVADEVRDEAARDRIMGHVTEGMAENYRQQVMLDRLRAVVDHVRDWLMKAKPKSTKPGNAGHESVPPITVRTTSGTTLRYTG
jgi:integrase